MSKPKNKPGLSETRMPALNDTQFVALSSAAGDSAGIIVVPARIKGAAAEKFGQRLLELGLAAERRAKPGQAAWRHDQDDETRRFILVISKAGLAAINVESPDTDEQSDSLSSAASARNSAAQIESGPTSNGESKKGKGEPTGQVGSGKTLETCAPRGTPVPRAGRKQKQLIDLLSRDAGVGIAEIAAALGWLPHTTRAALTGLRHKGYELARSTDGERGSVYNITAMPITASVAESQAVAAAV